MHMHPSIGRIVHYMHNGAKTAAIITKVWGDPEQGCVNLTAFLPDGHILGFSSVTTGDGDGRWSWPVIAKG